MKSAIQQVCVFCLILLPHFGISQPTGSVAKVWVEELLTSIRNDFARPPVHARNLFHLSIVMHDAWAAIQPGVDTYFLGKELHGFQSLFIGFPFEEDSVKRVEQQHEAISFAAYRLIKHRFINAPGVFFIDQNIENRMSSMGYDINFTSVNYLTDGPAALGNYIAQEMINYGLQDGSNELANYQYQYYEPANDPIEVELPGNPNMIDPDRWQPISLSNPIDQAGNPLPSTPLHLGPEWGNVHPFALSADDASIHTRGGFEYIVYFDPGAPPYLDTITPTEMEDFFKWNFVLVSIWQSHLDPDDNTIWDISPANIGNTSSYPENWTDYNSFYDLYNGGDDSQGHSINPVTGLPYTPQLVKRADYARVLAEFWADGLDSETPPGHWFEIYNTVSEHPLFERKWKGQGLNLSDLEYDIRAYLTLGGAMHDAAIGAWSIKGWYDYPRPVSMIRYMADRGQSSDPLLPNFHPAGLPLIPGFVEIVEIGDPLVGPGNEHLHKIKLYTWRGPDFINDPEEDVAGVGWILAENWWPYQRPSFVSPPFAGYISGHSTYSSAAAVAFEFITGSPYFPGGMSEFVASQNTFLEFEHGPSETIVLQWATYKDAADQCSLSRLWGGIHPPIDDIPGRLIGQTIGENSTDLSDNIINIHIPHVTAISSNTFQVNESTIGQELTITIVFDSIMDTNQNPIIHFPILNPINNELVLLDENWITPNSYVQSYQIIGEDIQLGAVAIGVKEAKSIGGTNQKPIIMDSVFIYDTEKPQLIDVAVNYSLINNQHNAATLLVDFHFSKPCLATLPITSIFPEDISNYSFPTNPASDWMSTSHYQSVWDINLINPIEAELTVSLDAIMDLNGNQLNTIDSAIQFVIDNVPPIVTSASSNQLSYNLTDVGTGTMVIHIGFSKPMQPAGLPELIFEFETDAVYPASENTASSAWTHPDSLTLAFDLLPGYEYHQLDLRLDSIIDLSGNVVAGAILPLQIGIDTRKPEITQLTPSTNLVDIYTFMNQDFYVEVEFDEWMNLAVQPLVSAYHDGSLLNNVTYNPFNSNWISTNTFRAYFTLPNVEMNLNDIYFRIAFARDSFDNVQETYDSPPIIDISYDPSTADISTQQLDHSIQIFPNPVQVGHPLQIQTPETVTKLELYDLAGQLIDQYRIISPTKALEYLIPACTSGIYLLHIETSTDSSIHKLRID
jgi:hypothetical protein